MAKEELKHCPVCGGKGKVHYKEPYTWVACKKCGLSTDKFPDFSEQKDPVAREMAIDDWNELEVL